MSAPRRTKADLEIKLAWLVSAGAELQAALVEFKNSVPALTAADPGSAERTQASNRLLFARDSFDAAMRGVQK